MQQSRAERLERIAAAEDNDEEPKHRDVRPHRRSLAQRCRKHGRLSFTIADLRLLEASDDGRTLARGSRRPLVPDGRHFGRLKPAS